MDLSDFAERILFGDTLDDKLLSPDVMVDEARRAVARVPDFPARPQSLRLQDDEARHKRRFPGLGALESQQTRGHVLHFFANHELLALELMALMLLRFPDAPASFRAGIYHTMREEQGHLRLYQREMERAEVAFGEIPVNAFFWRVLRDMHSPLDFVTGMSMTFEQANLDFSGYYARAFRRIGDTTTADVLDIVYAEEIGHVKHGVAWFDRWRPPDEPRFRAYEVLLPEGISPVRAKGKEFDVEARRQAGLDEDYIAHLRLYRASKGRPPRLLWFNPGVEHEQIAGSHRRPAVMDATAADLELCMAHAAAEEDILLARHAVSNEMRAYLDGIGLPLPKILVVDPSIPISDQIATRHIGRFVPWGVANEAKRLFAPLADRLVESGVADWHRWQDGTRLRDKASMHPVRVACLRGWAQETSPFVTARIVPADDIGVTLTSVEAIEAIVSREPVHDWVLKAPWSASGRGAIRLLGGEITASQRGWIARVLQRDRALVMEPWRERLLDFSWQMDIEDDGIVHHGLQRFIADARGQYRGAFLHRMTDGLSSELTRWIHDNGQNAHWIRSVQHDIADRVADHLRQSGYRGPVGIDAIVYREAGRLWYHPAVEINTRWTFGRIAHALVKRVSRRCSAVMLLVPVSSLVAEHGTVAAAKAWGERCHAVRVTGAGPEKQITGGIVWLGEVDRAQQHVPVLCVASNWEAVCTMANALASVALDPLSQV